MDVSSTDCALARESVSADLDGELSELDSRRLQVHLRVCADCSAWAEQIAVATLQLREAPVESPTAPVFELQRRRYTRGVAPALAAAVVAVVAVFLGGAHHGPVGPRTTSTPVNPSDLHAPAVQHRAFRAV